MSASRSYGPACTPGASWRSTACLCQCHLGSMDHDDVVCAATVRQGAVLVAGGPLVAAPARVAIASSHRTGRTQRRFVAPF